MNLKPITHEGIPSALQKAERYRLLNDSAAAESICLDVLDVDPGNQEALVSLLLAITDQFTEELADGVRRAKEVLPRLTDPYERVYYTGIISERRARAREPFPTPVRTLDAMHLASADFLRHRGQDVTLATYDDRLAAAARRIGLATVIP